MEIGIVYSSKDPRQKQARDFVKSFIHEHGLLANFCECDQDVPSPTLVVNGMALCEKRKHPRDSAKKMFPDIPIIRKTLEYHSWCL